ncbi:MAG: N-acetyltransferase [Saprospiraceae bacterium]|nr:N-acetyltransferase [Bacteroidia bacterium]MBT8229126.1 N-acetyltransferase [Bacteroidia bacterium]NNF21255.1 N-acetyltransferase [Saprospiraceae bacterium]
MSVFIHETAIVDQGASIGEGVRIWHFCHIMSEAVIGDHSSLGQNVFVADKVEIGKRNKIQNNVSLYQGVSTGEDVFIGPSVVFTNVINPRSAISRKSEYRTTIIKKGASIGANATIICGITIGQYAFIGAGAVVTRNVKDYQLVKGNPARPSGWMSRHGHKLGFNASGEAICPGTGERYFLIDDECRPEE